MGFQLNSKKVDQTHIELLDKLDFQALRIQSLETLLQQSESQITVLQHELRNYQGKYSE